RPRGRRHARGAGPGRTPRRQQRPARSRALLDDPRVGGLQRRADRARREVPVDPLRHQRGQVMSLDAALNVSASALTAERTRVEVAVPTLANAESTRGADAKPSRRRDVVLAADAATSFDAALNGAGAVGVKVAAIVEDQSPFPRRYDPSHPDADKEGFVA